MEKKKKQVALIVLDGWGFREDIKNNAIASAKKPFFDSLWEKYPHSLLKASGEAVGLPEGQMGNSEVGHMTIGTGKILDTDLVRISKSIETGEFENIPAFGKIFSHVKKTGSVLHAMGLIGPGGVHALDIHLLAFLKAAKKAGVKKVAIHAFLDGRDTPPQSGAGYLRTLEQEIKEIGVGSIASVCGRYFAMDRDNNWDRLVKAEKAIFEGVGISCQSSSPSECLADSYKNDQVDEMWEPHIFADAEGKNLKIEKNDAIFFFNFRADRARMMSKKITEKMREMNLVFVTMTEYDKNFDCGVAFPPINIVTTLSEEVSKAGLTQAHIAETEKFAHATYFLNGGKEVKYEGETDVLIPSRKDVPTHDLAPEMKAREISLKAVEFIKNGTDFIFINFANADMVGHTANVEAIIKAIEEVDLALGDVVGGLEKVEGCAFITADHGNAEVNIDELTGAKHTAHTTNPVPAILTLSGVNLKAGGLSDVAPTILELLNIPKPSDMTGNSLIAR